MITLQWLTKKYLKKSKVYEYTLHCAIIKVTGATILFATDDWVAANFRTI